VAGAAQYSYDVALSFAFEDREAVFAIAECLRARGVSVFCTDFETSPLWGDELPQHLVDVYLRWARYAVVFVSVDYRDKLWLRDNLMTPLVRALAERGEHLLTVRFDDSELEGLPERADALDLRQETPEEVCLHICETLGFVNSGEAARSPWSRWVQGSARFDYSSHRGRYRIGQGLWEFETAWRKANVSIFCLSGPPSIHALAILPADMAVTDIADAALLDYTSPVRQPKVGQVIVLENSNGFFAAIEITSIKDSTRWAGPDELAFDYWVARDGGRDFSAVQRL
jgi:hypothetical protein